MTQPSRVIYLPPGVVPGPAAGPAQPHASPTPGIPFDRVFFEQVLPRSIAAFCTQVDCESSPLVELLTVDGSTHYVKGISGVADLWVALHTTDPERDHPVQVFVAYQTILRVAVHPGDDERRGRLGFALEATVPDGPVTATRA